MNITYGEAKPSNQEIEIQNVNLAKRIFYLSLMIVSIEPSDTNSIEKSFFSKFSSNSLNSKNLNRRW